MIERFVDTGVTIGAGLVVGWWLAPDGRSATEQPLQPEPPEIAAPAPAPAPILPPQESLAGKATDCAIPSASPAPTAVLMPELYLDWIGYPPEPQTERYAYDYYADFAQDVRDEPWAAAMEAGIADFMARRLPPDKVVVDYVQCRSRQCVIAGYALADDTSAFGEIRNSGWWQAQGITYEVMTSGRDGRDNFVVFFERYPHEN